MAPEELSAFMKHTPRVILFGGQGTRALFSSSTAQTIQKDVYQSSAVSALVSQCHAAFLQEIASLDSDTKHVLDLNDTEFHDIKHFLGPSPKYRRNGLIQATTICLYQLVHYLAETERSHGTFASALEDVLEVTGFCAGLITAAVVAASNSVAQFQKFAVEAFRLSFWVGCRTAIAGRKGLNQQSEEGSCLLVVSGLSHEDVTRRLEEFRGKAVDRVLRISAISGPTNISISGPWSDLRDFKKLLGSPANASFAHVHGWYHGGEYFTSIVDKVMQDVQDRHVRYPCITDIVKPIRSSFDGTILDVKDRDDLKLDNWVVRHLLVYHTDWERTAQNIVSRIQEISLSGGDVLTQLVSFGPSSQLLFDEIRRKNAAPSIVVVDCSPFEMAKKNLFEPSSQEGIAIVGMGMNLPGGRTPSEMWETLSKAKDMLKEVPQDRFTLSDYYCTDENRKPRTMRARHGGFLEDIWTFDHSFFKISPREAKSMDPQQRILLHVAQSALDDAGYVEDATPSFQRASMGCYVGVATGDYTDNLRESIDVYYSPGTLRAFHSGRISYMYRLSGPSITIDTACSSSLVSIYQACRALQNGDCSAALAGGVNVICSPDMFLGLDRGHFLSPNGGCKPFDVSADGYGRAEGCVLFVLKRLSDAIVENDYIHGVIKDVVVNQSGNAKSITHPHSETQKALFSHLLKKNDIDPSTISVVEAHGTGTQAGDLRELASLQEVFEESHTRENPLIISSVKGNIGHCEAASGAAGLVKLLLMLRYEETVAQGGLKVIHPRWKKLDETGLVIPQQGGKWRASATGLRRAMLNNFGAAGSNAALLLEEAAMFPDSRPSTRTRSALVFNLSAKTPIALQDTIEDHLEFLEGKRDVDLMDICYTATARRQVYDYRISLVCASMDDLKTKLRNVEAAKVRTFENKRNMIFVFTGQGSIYPGMGEELMWSSSLFREWVLRCDTMIQQLGYDSILPYVNSKESKDILKAFSNPLVTSQLACVVVEYALAQLLISFGITPNCVIGHSLGEYTALAIANALSLEDMLRIVAGRAKLMTTLCEPASSTMIACRLSPTEAEKMIEEHPGLSKFSVACRNSSNDCVLAGPLDDIATLEESFRNQVKATKLDVPYGFHSVAMDPIVEPLKELGKSSTWMHPTIPVASNVLGRLIKPGELSHDYFARHARHTVRFEDAARDVMAHGFLKNTVWLEIGPHPTTLPMIRSMLNSSSSTCVPTLRRDLAAWASLSTSLSQLFLYIDTIDWRKVFGSSQAKMTQLPGYPLRGTTHGVLYREISSGLVDGESEVSESQKKTAFQLLPTLRVPQSAEHRHVFETSTERLAPLILGHEVGGTSICPASVFIELALEAATTVWKVYENEVLVVQNLNFHHPLVCVSKGNPRSVSVQLSGEGLQPHTEFRVTSEGTDGASDTDHCTGLISTMQTSELKDRWLKEAAIINRQSKYILTLSDGSINHFKRKTLYESIFTRVVRYSDDFQGLSDFSVSESSLEGLGSFRVPAKAQRDNLVVPPVFTDTLLHAAGFIANLYTKPEEISICVHVGMTEILYRELDDEESFTVYCSLFENSKGAIIADAFAINPAGAVVASVGGMEFKKLRLSTFQRLLSGSQTPTEPAKQDKEVDEDQVMANKIARTASSKHITSSETQLRPHQPHQDVRQIVARIFSEVCQTSENDLDYAAPLDTYGIDSLMQIEIAARLKQAFPKQHIDQNILFDGKSLTALEQTITDLVSKEANDQSCSSSSTPGSRNDATYGSSPSPVSPGRERSSSSTSASDVVPSNPVACHISKGGATPLYLFHDGSGSMRMYTAIQAFDRTTYAFFDPHILDIKAPFTRLDHMAQDYISHLSLSRNEPIILGGWSFGGVLALEAARQLTTSGIPVKGLLLIDAPYPIGHEPLPTPIIDHVLNFIAPHASAPDSARDPHATLRREFQRNASLLQDYQPHQAHRQREMSLPFPTVMLRSCDTFDTEALCGVRYDWLSSQETRDKAVRDWEMLLGPGSVAAVLSIPGNHFEPFMAKNIAETSARIWEACRIIDNAASI